MVRGDLGLKLGLGLVCQSHFHGLPHLARKHFHLSVAYHIHWAFFETSNMCAYSDQRHTANTLRFVFICIHCALPGLPCLILYTFLLLRAFLALFYEPQTPPTSVLNNPYDAWCANESITLSQRRGLPVLSALPLESVNNCTIRKEHTCQAEAQNGHANRIALRYPVQLPFYLFTLRPHHVTRFL